MTIEWRGVQHGSRSGGARSAVAGTPGKRTLTEAAGVPVQAGVRGPSGGTQTPPAAAVPEGARRTGPRADGPRAASITSLFGRPVSHPEAHVGSEANAAAADGAAPVVAGTGGGDPLPAPLRAEMERNLGVDLSEVRIHQSEEVAAAGAHAVTRGNDIHFAPGAYDPSTAAGKELLGHELAHVVQQREGRVGGSRDPGGGLHVDTALEAEADGVGARLSRGDRAGESRGDAAGRTPTTGRMPASGPAQPKLHLTSDFRATPQNEAAFRVVQKNMSELGQMVFGVFDEGNRFNLTFDVRDFEDKSIFARTAIRYESERSSGNVDTGALPNLRNLWDCTRFDVTVYINSGSPKAGNIAEVMASLVHEITVHVMSQAEMLVLLRSCRSFGDFKARVTERGLLQKGGPDDVDVEHDQFGKGQNFSYHRLAVTIWKYLSTPGQHYYPEIAERFSLAAAADVLSHSLPAMAKVLSNDPELKALCMEEEKKGEMDTNDFARVILEKYPDLIMRFLCP